MLKSEIVSWTRWLHIYLSMFSFATLLFFSVTGITLNHTDLIEGQQKVEQAQGQVTLDWVSGDSSAVNELQIVEHLRNTHNIKAKLKDFVTEELECAVSFKGPGFTADGFIDRATGTYQLMITRSGAIAIMNDLHKGRDTGTAWSWLIDVSALLMILVSLSGFLMIFFLKRRRLNGLLMTALGLLLLIVIYYMFAQ